MSRYYDKLECGCLISCDGGGGYISGCDGKNCKADDYFLKHNDWENGECKTCYPPEKKTESEG